MAGTIEVGPDVKWSAAGRLFDWVLSQVASEGSDAELAGHLRGIVGENLGYLSLPEVEAQQRTQFRDAVQGLRSIADTRWRDFDGRDGALEHLDALKECIG